MKGFVGTVVIVGCIVGVVMWALLVRYRAELESVRGIDPCALDEVACASTSSGLVHHATFTATGARGDSPSAALSVSCVRSLWDVGIAFREFLPPGTVQRRLGVLRHRVAAVGREGLVGLGRVPVELGAARVRRRGVAAGAALGRVGHGRPRR